jgi:plasmid stabilization system protein ParE
VKVRVLEPAVEDLEAIHEYIARDNHRAADTFIGEVRAHLRRIAETGFGEIGRPGHLRGCANWCMAATSSCIAWTTWRMN